eukprot:Pgem_evm3s19198
MHVLQVAGETVTYDMINHVLPYVKHVQNLYGCTELTGCVSGYEISKPSTFSSLGTFGTWTSNKVPSPPAHNRIPIGRSIFNCSLKIVHPLTHSLQPIGVPGELVVQYHHSLWNQKAMVRQDNKSTESVFLPKHFTGDIACFMSDPNSGNEDYFVLDLLGRKNQQNNLINFNGMRLDLLEIRYCLKKVLQVKESFVTIYDDVLVAYVSSIPDVKLHNIGEQEFSLHVQKLLEKHLPKASIPNIIINLEALPININGKINQSVLKTRFDEYLQNRLMVLNNSTNSTNILIVNSLPLLFPLVPSSSQGGTSEESGKEPLKVSSEISLYRSIAFPSLPELVKKKKSILNCNRPPSASIYILEIIINTWKKVVPYPDLVQKNSTYLSVGGNSLNFMKLWKELKAELQKKYNLLTPEEMAKSIVKEMENVVVVRESSSIITMVKKGTMNPLNLNFILIVFAGSNSAMTEWVYEICRYINTSITVYFISPTKQILDEFENQDLSAFEYITNVYMLAICELLNNQNNQSNQNNHHAIKFFGHSIGFKIAAYVAFKLFQQTQYKVSHVFSGDMGVTEIKVTQEQIRGFNNPTTYDKNLLDFTILNINFNNQLMVDLRPFMSDQCLNDVTRFILFQASDNELMRNKFLQDNDNDFLVDYGLSLLSSQVDIFPCAGSHLSMMKISTKYIAKIINLYFN